MYRISRGPVFKGLIAVWEDNGKTVMVGSKEAYNWSLAWESDIETLYSYDSLAPKYIPRSAGTITLEVTMPAGYMSTAEYIPNAPQIARKGIYLPNMTFLALEDKGE